MSSNNTRNIFTVNAVHTVLQDLLLPLRSTKIASCYNWWAGTLILVLQIFMHKFCMNMNKLCMNTHEFAWKCMNFAWTQVNFAWTQINLHEHAWKLIKISGFAVDIWAMWPVSEIDTLIFWWCLKALLFYSKYVKSIYNYHHYIHCSIYLYAPAPSLKKGNFCYEQIYLSLVGKGLTDALFL